MENILSSLEFIMRGGFMMYPLLLAGLVGLTVVIERSFRLHRSYITPAELTAQVIALTRSQELEKAAALCERYETPVASVLAAGVSQFNHSLDEMNLTMKNRAEEWVPKLESRIEVIDTVITAAPLMGLLGTITGMMASFRVLSEKGVNEPHAITGGVAEALIATATGLVIALLCLVAYNHLAARVKAFIYEVETAASRLVEARMAVERKNGSR